MTDRFRVLARALSGLLSGEGADSRRIRHVLQSCGKGTRLGRNVRITHPQWVSIGHRVRIDADARLETEGGLCVGHGARIGRGVAIRTTARDAVESGHARRPVLIGRGASIGAGARIEPGSAIGDGAIVEPGAVVQGAVAGKAGVASPRERSAATTRFVFIPSTGRSGTTTMASLLSSHPEICCRHERRRQLIRLSTELAHGIVDEAAAEAELHAIYVASGAYRLPVYGDSDHRLFNLVGILGRVLPEAKFVWLVRDGRDVVASTTARGWYDAEYTSGIWGEYRLRGDAARKVGQAEWDAMTPFAKNCWYWAHVNREIGAELARMSAERWTTLRLEDLRARVDDVFRFLEVAPVAVGGLRENPSRRAVVPPREWSRAQHDDFERWCGEIMDRWYPGWRG
ncbi:MAG TPA: sulfotransferase [Gemmatimonadota bacterium]|nr:sulfotransferase [Gemmatimonadota bacterium]